MQALNPMCQVVNVAVGVAGAGANVVDGAFSHIAGYFGLAAQSAATWLWQQISDATSLDLSSPALAREMGVTGAIAGVLCLALFVIQVTMAAVRGHPVAMGRAVTGLLISFVGSALALGTTRVLIGAVDALSEGVVTYTMGTNIGGMGTKLAFVGLNQVQNPAAVIVLAVVIIMAVVVVWAAMMIRKLMLLVAAVLAPLAFAGATADFARGWVRRWIEFVCAMVVSKLLLVIILSIGVAVLNGAGQTNTGVSQTVTQLAGGCLILLLGGLAPWIAIRMFHFAGDTLHAAAATARQATAGAQTLISAPQKVSAIQGQSRVLASVGSSGSGGSSAARFRPLPPPGPPGPPPPPGGAGSSTPPSSLAPGGGSGSPGLAGAANGSGGAAAASVAAPVAVLAGVAMGTKAVVNKTASAVGSATPASAPPGPPAPNSSAAAPRDSVSKQPPPPAFPRS
ncbi:hypothetical protein GCM10009826_29100 [Humibacillus xanthopallidus]